MATKQPIRDRKDIQRMKDYLMHDSAKNPILRLRNYTLFVTGINSGLRMGDIRDLKVEDVTGWRIKHFDEKTGKFTDRKMNSSLKKAIRNYLGVTKLKNEDYLFPGSFKQNRKMSESQAWRIITSAANFLGIPEIGTHSMRKTFGFQIFTTQGNKTVGDIMKLLNHQKESTTLAYIGVTRDSEDRTVDKLNL
ncbi:tyrosine-type recombinase/integrase [Streptococcus suis]